MIDACQPTRLRLDGPSLMVQRTGQASRRFPLRLLRQVVVTGSQLDGLPAAIECAAQQINVYFLNASSEIRAQLIGYFPSAVEWNEWFDQCRWSQSWLGVYEAAIAQSVQCLCVESRLFGQLRNSGRNRYYQQTAAALKRRWGKSAYADARQWLRGFATVTATQAMLETGVASGHRFKARLLQDATQLLFMDALFNCHQDNCIAPPDNAHGAGVYYHARAEVWRSLLTRLYMSLEYHFTEKEKLDGLRP